MAKISKRAFDRRFPRPMFPVFTENEPRNNAKHGESQHETLRIAARQGKLGALRGPCRAAFFMRRFCIVTEYEDGALARLCTEQPRWFTTPSDTNRSANGAFTVSPGSLGGRGDVHQLFRLF